MAKHVPQRRLRNINLASNINDLFCGHTLAVLLLLGNFLFSRLSMVANEQLQLGRYATVCEPRVRRVEFYCSNDHIYCGWETSDLGFGPTRAYRISMSNICVVEGTEVPPIHSPREADNAACTDNRRCRGMEDVVSTPSAEISRIIVWQLLTTEPWQSCPQRWYPWRHRVLSRVLYCARLWSGDSKQIVLPHR